MFGSSVAIGNKVNRLPTANGADSSPKTVNPNPPPSRASIRVTGIHGLHFIQELAPIDNEVKF
jgi:hypothetical protein